MIDIHVIPVPGYESNLNRLIRACETPIAKVHIANYVPGNILRARLNGFSIGSNPYVTWIDGDDEVLDVSWFKEAVEILKDSKIAAVYPRFKITHLNGKITTLDYKPWTIQQHLNTHPLAHHLTIMRRKHVELLLKVADNEIGCLVKNTEKYLMSGLTRFGRFEAVNHLAYNWILRSNSGRTIADSSEALAWLRAKAAEDARIFRQKYGECP